jgi:hypothetical protein
MLPAAARADSSAPATSASYLAFMTGFQFSIANVARQAATRSEGRPRREIREVPWDAPDALSDGDSPACLTMEEEVS